jgi:hypothetical protein
MVEGDDLKLQVGMGTKRQTSAEKTAYMSVSMPATLRRPMPKL